MTDEARKSYEWLLSLASGKGFESSHLIGAPEAAEQSADTIDELSKKVEEYETQIAGLEIMLTTAQSAAETWKRRAEAAERDIRAMLVRGNSTGCYFCSKPCQFYNSGSIMDVCISQAKWRGPCAENGGES